MTQVNKESIFDGHIKSIIPLLEKYFDYDLVIGIPFDDEAEALPQVLQSIDEVLDTWIGSRQLIVCAGDASGKEVLKKVQELELKHPHCAFVLPAEANGRGMAIRSLIEIAKILEADLLLFSANMATPQGPGIDGSLLESLLTPIQGQYDMVLGSLRRHLGIDSIAHMLAAPVLESFYGSRVSDPLGGIYALAHDFVEELSGEAKFWTDVIGGSGIDFWLITRALSWNKNICEVNTGGVIRHRLLEKRNQVFYEMALTIFECIRRDSAIWLRERLIIKIADILARSEVQKPDIIDYPIKDLIASFRKSWMEYQDIFEQGLPIKIQLELKEFWDFKDEKFHLSDQLWVSCILNFLLKYSFDDKNEMERLLKALTGLYNGRIASYAIEMQTFRERVQACSLGEQDDLMVGKMDSIRQRLSEEFWRSRSNFCGEWVERIEQARPPLVPLGYMEYVPGRPVVVPKIINGKDKRIVQTDGVFRRLRKVYEDRFNQFINLGLGVANESDPTAIRVAVSNFMAEVERALDKLLPGSLYTIQGMEQFVDGLFALVPHQPMFTISSEMLREMLIRFPPINLMIPLGYYKPEELIKNLDPRDAVTYANLVENWSYSDRDLLWVAEQLKPEKFEWTDLKPMVINDELPFGAISHTKITNLNKLTARITVKPLEPGKGGKFPKLRYFVSIVRRIAVAENYSQLFRQNVKERKNIGLKARNTLLDLKRGDDFSAYNIFENINHRALVAKLRTIAGHFRSEGEKELAQLFTLMADGYGLSQVLENGSFLTCTCWSWASYSFKGGLKIPTPSTTSIEGRWFNHDFLEELYRELGYDVKEIEQIIFRLIQSGHSDQNLLDTLLPARPKDVAVVIQESTNEPAKSLQRYEGNPLLEPVEDHDWECKYVLNPGALRIKDKVYLFYRAVGKDDISRIGMAITDGYRVLERLLEPIFSPAFSEEKMGCEDPRLIIIGEKIWMLYTAYDGNIAQIAAASINTKDFLERRFDLWKREGLAFKNIWDKDAILFPEKIKGKYILYHRIEPSMWITYMNEVAFPCREKHAIIIGPRPGRMWDSLKIGAGAQPLKTKYGWLLIYHGVDHNYVYRLGVILVDLANPQKVIYRSPNPILEPLEDYEIGLSGAWVPNVVFTCGAVPGTDKDVLEDKDEVLVYYGAADTSIGLASATLADLIPERFRQL